MQNRDAGVHAPLAADRGIAPDGAEKGEPRSGSDTPPQLTPDPKDLYQPTKITGRGYGLVFQSKLQQVMEAPLLKATDVELLRDGIVSFPARKALIEGAKTSLFLQTFIFTDDATGREAAALLCAAAKRGVKVRVIVDAMGADPNARALLASMKKAGVEVQLYADRKQAPHLINARWHEKLLVADAAHAITGGMNIGDVYAKGGSGERLEYYGRNIESWRDTDLRVSGPVAREMALGFLKNWSLVRGKTFELEDWDKWVPPPEAPAKDQEKVQAKDLETGRADTGFFQHDPKTGDVAHDVWWLSIIAAKRTIDIENPYLVLRPHLMDALLEAARRGVKIRIMTNSDLTNDIVTSTDRARELYAQLQAPDVARNIELWETTEQMVHAKTGTFDGVFSIVASANLNGRSGKRDTESGVVTFSRTVATELRAAMDSGRARCRRIEPDTLPKLPLRARLRNWLTRTFLPDGTV